MKSNQLVICALLGAAQAVAKHYNYDDQEQYDDGGIRAFMEHNTVSVQNEDETKPVLAVKPPPVQESAVTAHLKDVHKTEPPKNPVEQNKQEPQEMSQLPQPPQALSESELTAENLAKKEMDTEMSNNDGDDQYVQIGKESRFAFLVNNIQSPEDLGFLQMTLKKKGWHGRRITDMDGDGIEDNEELDHDTLDEFYDPLVFGVAEDIHNTRHGNLPGHKQMWFTESLTEPVDHRQDIVKKSWETK